VGAGAGGAEAERAGGGTIGAGWGGRTGSGMAGRCACWILGHSRFIPEDAPERQVFSVHLGINALQRKIARPLAVSN
jgi:hypothetical protein